MPGPGWSTTSKDFYLMWTTWCGCMKISAWFLPLSMQINPLHSKIHKWLPWNYLNKPSTTSSYTSDPHTDKAKYFGFFQAAFPLNYCEYLFWEMYLMRLFSLTPTAQVFVLIQLNFGCLLTNESGLTAALPLVNDCLKCSI